jgi:WD40 repeat protein
MEPSVIREAHRSHVPDVLFSGDGQFLVSAGMDNVVHLWSVAGWSRLRTLGGHAHSVNAIALSSDGRTLASGSSDATVRLWTFPRGELQQTLQDRKRVVSDVVFSPDGEWVVAASYGGRVAVWTLEGEPVAGFAASTRNLTTVAFSPDGRTVAVGGLGSQVGLWSLPRGEPQGALEADPTAVLSLAFADRGRALISLGYEGSIRVWDAETWQEMQRVQVDAEGPRRLVLSGHEGHAAVCVAGQVQLWSTARWECQYVLDVGPKSVETAAFSPDGRWLAVGAADGRIRVWDLASL